VRLQTTCAENSDGTSTVFAAASRDINKVQNEKQHRGAGCRKEKKAFTHGDLPGAASLTAFFCGLPAFATQRPESAAKLGT
jgi:hypothetical protein